MEYKYFKSGEFGYQLIRPKGMMQYLIALFGCMAAIALYYAIIKNEKNGFIFAFIFVLCIILPYWSLKRNQIFINSQQGIIIVKNGKKIKQYNLQQFTGFHTNAITHNLLVTQLQVFMSFNQNEKKTNFLLVITLRQKVADDLVQEVLSIIDVAQNNPELNIKG